jgi:Ethanolamine utilization protein EutJ (predicted chaperonin)
MADDRYVVDAVIPNGTALSNIVNVNANDIVGIQMPTDWTTGAVTFAVLNHGTGVYEKLVDSGGTEISYTVAASTVIHLATPLKCLGLLKVRSGTAATPVNQTAARTIKLIFAKEG